MFSTHKEMKQYCKCQKHSLQTTVFWKQFLSQQPIYHICQRNDQPGQDRVCMIVGITPISFDNHA